MRKLHFYRLVTKALVIGLLGLGIQACQSPQEKGTLSTYYTEPHRPQVHFSPEYQWMNDPNGMVYYEGEYHLFYQYHPESTVWGPMHWGHAVSTDLVHWDHLPIGIYPDSLGTIFSGSAVVDWDNTSGFGADGKPPLVAIFTQHSHELEAAGSDVFQTQGIAYSVDKGRTWTMYEGNPVIPNPGIRDFRDPKVRWHEASQQWVMILAAKDRVKLYSSPDLKSWTFSSDFGADVGSHGGVWECPDLFPLKVQDSDEIKWVMLVSINPGGPNGGSATQYFIGNFDGRAFTLDPDFAARLGTTGQGVPPGRLFADFEGEDFGKWSVEGNAFGVGPVRGALEGQRIIEGFSGGRLANSFHGGDASMGTLTSPIFVNEYPYINFKIGGGQHPGKTGINLLVEGEVVRSATGNNREMLLWKHWDVRDFLGQPAQLQVLDAATEGWGHINVDQVLFANETAQSPTEKAVWLDYGRDNYAGVTWSDIPESDGRRIFIGWMSNWDYARNVPTREWRSAMTLPRTLALAQTPQGLFLRSQPVGELESIRKEGSSLKFDQGQLDSSVVLTDAADFLPGVFEATLTCKLPQRNTRVGIELANLKGETYRCWYDADRSQFISDRTQSGPMGFSDIFAYEQHKAPRISDSETLQMHIFVDLASIEVFADGGLTVLTEVFFPSEDFTRVSLLCENGILEEVEWVMHPLETIWR